MKRFKASTMKVGKARYDSKLGERDLYFHLASIHPRCFLTFVDSFYGFLANQIDESDNLAADRKPSLAQIMTDANTAISAGADTTASVLANCVYCLIKIPADLKRLQLEIDAAPAASDDEDEDVLSDAQKLADMPFLNAVMYV